MGRIRWSLVAALTFSSVLAFWIGRAPEGQRPPPREQPAVTPAATTEGSLSRPLAPVAVTRREPSPSLNVVGPGPDDPHEPGMVPHPLDEARARLDRENRLLQALNDAMSFRKVDQMRELLVTYQALDPQDVDKSQHGYRVIADCIEFPGERSHAEARRFYETERHSPLRRFVRRICFEGSS